MSDTEMVERVARAIFPGWEDLNESTLAICRRAARDTIEAMREPTNEMLDSATRACAARQAMDNETDTTFIWQAMIDAVLGRAP